MLSSFETSSMSARLYMKLLSCKVHGEAHERSAIREEQCSLNSLEAPLCKWRLANQNLPLMCWKPVCEMMSDFQAFRVRL